MNEEHLPTVFKVIDASVNVVYNGLRQASESIKVVEIYLESKFDDDEEKEWVFDLFKVAHEKRGEVEKLMAKIEDILDMVKGEVL